MAQWNISESEFNLLIQNIKEAKTLLLKFIKEMDYREFIKVNWQQFVEKCLWDFI